jgi:polyphosphate kinase
MRRNLESRVEVLVPVDDEALRETLRAVFDVQWKDRHNVWDMGPDGRYTRRRRKTRKPTGGEPLGCQNSMIDSAERRNFEANRLRKRKPRVLSRRVR